LYPGASAIVAGAPVLFQEHLMRTLLGTMLLAVLLAGCGENQQAATTPPAAAPEATATG
jgi:uncharacterized lipoprotein YajG